MGRHAGFRDYEPAGLTGVGDVIAMSTLITFFANSGIKPPSVLYSDPPNGDELTGNLIVLGDADMNKVAKLIDERGETAIEAIGIKFQDKLSGRLFEPHMNAQKTSGVDVGVIIKTVNPYSSGSYVFILAGSYGYGTRAAATLATSSDFLSLVKSRWSTCECVFSVDVVNDVPQQPKILLLRSS
jgi:hypothetical protein